jgi:hypothetical protein
MPSPPAQQPSRRPSTTGSVADDVASSTNPGGVLAGAGGAGGGGGGDRPRPTLLQPRVAVVLGVSRPWQAALVTCRAASCGPAVWWSLPIALRLLVQVHRLATGEAALGESESRLRVTETSLAMMWVGAYKEPPWAGGLETAG